MHYDGGDGGSEEKIEENLDPFLLTFVASGSSVIVFFLIFNPGERKEGFQFAGRGAGRYFAPGRRNLPVDQGYPSAGIGSQPEVCQYFRRTAFYGRQVEKAARAQPFGEVTIVNPLAAQ